MPFIILELFTCACLFFLTALVLSCFRYRPVLPVKYVERTLGFADREDVLAFLAELNVTLAEDGASVDCKESLAAVLAS